MLFNKENYRVFKCTEQTEELYDCIEYEEDDYGRTQSDFYYLEQPYNHQQTMYSDFVNVYCPIAPSGNYNQRFGELYQKSLKNMELVGTYDGNKFDCEVPMMFTSIHELKPLNVFELENDHTYRAGVFKADPLIVIPSHIPLVLERFDDIGYQVGEWLIVSELKSGQKHKIHGNLRINKLGYIKCIREFIKE